MKKSLGGDRLGSGAKMDVELHGYERSTHDLGRIFRTTMSAGTLIPCAVEVALPGDTFDINLDMVVKTHPTLGPLFGSAKCQIDAFLAPIRLYQAKLHNNALNIGMKMNTIKLPQLTLYGLPTTNADGINTAQIEPSCLLKYLGMSGVGYTTAIRARKFNGVPFLMYWDTYKNYYANKQEEKGAVINTPRPSNATGVINYLSGTAIPQYPSTNNITFDQGDVWAITGTSLPDLRTIQFLIDGQWVSALALEAYPQAILTWVQTAGTTWTGFQSRAITGTVQAWDFAPANEVPFGPPQVELFDLDNIDMMRNYILSDVTNVNAFDINGYGHNLSPYSAVAIDTPATAADIPYLSTQQGLGLKTYQADLFNNWLQTDWIDGTDGINTITAVSTSGGSFKIDALIFARKIYDMLNRVAVSGGSYDDWIDAVYAHDRFTRIESPVYMGGLSKELVFQEVVSNAASVAEQTEQPLGTLAGKGVMGSKHKGGKIYIKVDEPSYIMLIASITPRVDYSQGNRWDTHLQTMDDFHKPALDQIGFQELITEQMAYWSTFWNAGTSSWVTRSAGKQPAWINYMTSYNQTFGNFATVDNEMFMTFNRRYEIDSNGIKDLTTYIDPVKFNYIFAQTEISAQNYWTQIAIDMTVRRKMSAKVMPNL